MTLNVYLTENSCVRHKPGDIVHHAEGGLWALHCPRCACVFPIHEKPKLLGKRNRLTFKSPAHCPFCQTSYSIKQGEVEALP